MRLNMELFSDADAATTQGMVSDDADEATTLGWGSFGFIWSLVIRFASLVQRAIPKLQAR